MEWNDEELENVKKGMSVSSKILLLMIGCILLIIMVLVLLLMSTKEVVFKISLDGKTINTTDKDTLLSTVGDVTYINIEEFSKLVGYEYHKGEYKSSTVEEDKCYVEGTVETVSFYLNYDKIFKLPVNQRESQYEEYTMDNPIISINDKMYAPAEAISKAFNVLIDEKDSTKLQIYTLNYLITLYDAKVKEWGYTGIVEQSLENQKSLLQGLLIVNKENGLYKIIDINNTKEVVLARYSAINYSENTEEFFVTDSSSRKVGIVKLDGSTKMEPIYDSISVLDKESELYIVQQSKKYGIATGTGEIIIYPEYDSIGINNSQFSEKLILDELIPVYKNKKWGAFNKEGNLVLNLEYDEFGYPLTSIEINGIKELVKPVLTIERANGLVVKKEEKYGLLDVTGMELVPIAVDAIYEVNDAVDEENKYFMLYNGEELNIIERLIRAGLIEEEPEQDENIPNEDNNESENIIDGNTDNSIDTEMDANTIDNNTENE